MKKIYLANSDKSVIRTNRLKNKRSNKQMDRWTWEHEFIGPKRMTEVQKILYSLYNSKTKLKKSCSSFRITKLNYEI